MILCRASLGCCFERQLETVSSRWPEMAPADQLMTIWDSKIKLDAWVSFSSYSSCSS